MVVIYIYFTRIVVYLLRSTMPYQYVWLSDAAGVSQACCSSLAFLCWPLSSLYDCKLAHDLHLNRLDSAVEGFHVHVGELATLAFYVTTAVSFRPTADNPYLHLADDDIDLQELREATL